MDAVSQALRPGLTEAAFQAARAVFPNPGPGVVEAARWVARTLPGLVHMKSITAGYGDGCCEHPFGNVFRHVSMNRAVHHLNGPFRAGNPFTMNAVSQALRPGLTEAARWAANPQPTPDRVRHLRTIMSKRLRQARREWPFHGWFCDHHQL
jgi:hypothetical protein